MLVSASEKAVFAMNVAKTAVTILFFIKTPDKWFVLSLSGFQQWKEITNSG
jgi:hypothetical protein